MELGQKRISSKIPFLLMLLQRIDTYGKFNQGKVFSRQKTRLDDRLIRLILVRLS